MLFQVEIYSGQCSKNAAGFGRSDTIAATPLSILSALFLGLFARVGEPG